MADPVPRGARLPQLPGEVQSEITRHLSCCKDFAALSLVLKTSSPREKQDGLKFPLWQPYGLVLDLKNDAVKKIRSGLLICSRQCCA